MPFGKRSAIEFCYLPGPVLCVIRAGRPVQLSPSDSSNAQLQHMLGAHAWPSSPVATHSTHPAIYKVAKIVNISRLQGLRGDMCT